MSYKDSERPYVMSKQEKLFLSAQQKCKIKDNNK